MSMPGSEADDGLIRPSRTGEAAAFWEACDHGELLVQACGACGKLRIPPRPMCPWCNATERAWQQVSGRGRIWSFVIPHPPLLPAYAAMAPYNVIVVALDEDPALRLTGNLVGSEEGSPGELLGDAIQIGSPVRVVFQRVASDLVLPRWAPLP